MKCQKRDAVYLNSGKIHGIGSKALNYKEKLHQIEGVYTANKPQNQ